MLKKTILLILIYFAFIHPVIAKGKTKLNKSFYCEIDVTTSELKNLHTLVWDLSKMEKLKSDKLSIYYKKIYKEEAAEDQKSSYISNINAFYNKEKKGEIIFDADIQMLISDLGKKGKVKKQYTIRGMSKINKKISIEQEDAYNIDSESFSNGSSFLNLTCFEGTAPKPVRKKRRRRR